MSNKVDCEGLIQTTLSMPSAKYLQESRGFVREYGGLDFPKVHFRPGASFSSEFGLTERYMVIDGKVVWGYPGIHKGVDRGYSKKTFVGKENGVFCPFDFGSSGFVDYGGKSYGSLIFLYHKLGFCLRIAHMFPDEINHLDRLKAGFAVKRDEHFGHYGTYGFSTGRHTHTEVEGWGFNGEWVESCEVLDWILEDKYGRKAREPFTTEEVCEISRQCSKVKEEDWNTKRILDHFITTCRSKGIVFINRHKIMYSVGGRLTTTYSTRSLFGM